MALTVRVNYPTDPEVLAQFQTRVARAIARTLVSELPPKEIDKLIEDLRNNVSN